MKKFLKQIFSVLSVALVIALSVIPIAFAIEPKFEYTPPEWATETVNDEVSDFKSIFYYSDSDPTYYIGLQIYENNGLIINENDSSLSDFAEEYIDSIVSAAKKQDGCVDCKIENSDYAIEKVGNYTALNMNIKYRYYDEDFDGDYFLFRLISVVYSSKDHVYVFRNSCNLSGMDDEKEKNINNDFLASLDTFELNEELASPSASSSQNEGFSGNIVYYVGKIIGYAFIAIITFIISARGIKKGKSNKKYRIMSNIVLASYGISAIFILVIKALSDITTVNDPTQFFGAWLGLIISVAHSIYINKTHLKSKSGFSYEDFETAKINYNKKYQYNPNAEIIKVYQRTVDRFVSCMPKIYYFKDGNKPVIMCGYAEICSNDRIADLILGYLRANFPGHNITLEIFENSSSEALSDFFAELKQHEAIGYRIDKGYNPVKIEFDNVKATKPSAKNAATDKSSVDKEAQSETSGKIKALCLSIKNATKLGLAEDDLIKLKAELWKKIISLDAIYVIYDNLFERYNLKFPYFNVNGTIEICLDKEIAKHLCDSIKIKSSDITQTRLESDINDIYSEKAGNDIFIKEIPKEAITQILKRYFTQYGVDKFNLNNGTCCVELSLFEIFTPSEGIVEKMNYVIGTRNAFLRILQMKARNQKEEKPVVLPDNTSMPMIDFIKSSEDIVFNHIRDLGLLYAFVANSENKSRFLYSKGAINKIQEIISNGQYHLDPNTLPSVDNTMSIVDVNEIGLFYMTSRLPDSNSENVIPVCTGMDTAENIISTFTRMGENLIPVIVTYDELILHSETVDGFVIDVPIYAYFKKSMTVKDEQTELKNDIKPSYILWHKRNQCPIFDSDDNILLFSSDTVFKTGYSSYSSKFFGIPFSSVELKAINDDNALINSLYINYGAETVMLDYKEVKPYSEFFKIDSAHSENEGMKVSNPVLRKYICIFNILIIENNTSLLERYMDKIISLLKSSVLIRAMELPEGCDNSDGIPVGSKIIYSVDLNGKTCVILFTDNDAIKEYNHNADAGIICDVNSEINSWIEKDYELVINYKCYGGGIRLPRDLLLKINGAHDYFLEGQKCLTQFDPDGDDVKAHDALLKAAKLGHENAMNNLAVLYQNGYAGNAPDINKAIYWYDKASDFLSESAFVLGRIYDVGDLVPQNLSKSAVYYKKAADKSHAMAMYNLASMYLNGEGVEQNELLANEYMRRSASLGYEPAKKLLGLN